jgi:hypothetical protein
MAAVAPSLLALTYWIGYQHGCRSTARTQSRENSQVAGLSREAILQLLPGKTWYSHWEIKDRKRPTKISVNDSGQIFVGEAETGKIWKLELRWVLNEGDHLFIPVDDYAVHGFFIASGRQKGLFADKP